MTWHLTLRNHAAATAAKQTTTLPDQLAQLEQRIAHTDDKINEKVYLLYGLSEEGGEVGGGEIVSNKT